MEKRHVRRCHNELFREALHNLLCSGRYHVSSPVEKHRMLLQEFERLYWEKRGDLFALHDLEAYNPLGESHRLDSAPEG